jgi:hypothetical protein
MQIPNPIPTCTQFDAVETACTTCGRQMRLILAEPYKGDSSRLQLRTYRCGSCGNGESYLVLS